MKPSRDQILDNHAAMASAVAACDFSVSHAAKGECDASLQFRGAIHVPGDAVFDLCYSKGHSYAGLGPDNTTIESLECRVASGREFETHRFPWTISGKLDDKDAEKLAISRLRILRMFSVDGEGSHPETIALMDVAFAAVRTAASTSH